MVWTCRTIDDNYWVKRNVMGRLKELDRQDAQKKSWWDCVMSDMESLGMSLKDAQFGNKWRRRKEN